MREWAEFLCIALLPVVLGLATLRFFRNRVRGRERVSATTLVAGNALLLLALSSVVLLGFETQLRLFYDASDGDNRTRVSKRWFERHWARNNFHLRDNIDYELRRRLSKRRISFVGDSFTAGHGVPNVEARYVNLLRARHPEWEVHSIAIHGLETETEGGLLAKYLGRGYELDVVVLAYYLENIGRYVPELAEYFERAARPLPQPLRFLVDHSYAVDTFYYRAQTRFLYAQGYWNDLYERAYAGPAWQEQQLAFRRFRRLVVDSSGGFATLTFPTLAGVEGRREILDRIERFWAGEGVPHLDLLPVLEPYASRELVANPHDAHPNSFAQRLAADAIERFLLERVLPENPPR